MRVRPVSPLGSPGDPPQPAARTRLPTPDRYPLVDEADHELRRRIYSQVKRAPLTAAQVASLFDLSIPEARDQLRVMENLLLVRHTADDLGVIYWRWSPANYWEMEPVPF